MHTLFQSHPGRPLPIDFAPSQTVFVLQIVCGSQEARQNELNDQRDRRESRSQVRVVAGVLSKVVQQSHFHRSFSKGLQCGSLQSENVVQARFEISLLSAPRTLPVAATSSQKAAVLLFLPTPGIGDDLPIIDEAGLRVSRD